MTTNKENYVIYLVASGKIFYLTYFNAELKDQDDVEWKEDMSQALHFNLKDCYKLQSNILLHLGLATTMTEDNGEPLAYLETVCEDVY